MSAELQIGRASSQAHWYTKAGEAAYEVPKASGSGFRPTTLRDARKLGLLPSVTSVMSIKAKPQLQNWIVRQAVMSALTLPRLDGESDDAFLSRVEQDRQAQARAAAEEGTRIHAAIEMHLLGQPYDAAYTAHVRGTMDALAGIDSGAVWRPEKAFASFMGYGGKVDLHSAGTARHPDGIVLDFKTKDFSDGDKLKPYDEWAVQLAAYAYGLELERADRYSVVVSRDNPGLVWVHAWGRDSMDNHWRQFAHMLELWKLDRRYEP